MFNVFWNRFKMIPPIVPVSLFGLIFGVNFVLQSQQVPPRSQPIRQPAVKPSINTVAGTGIVEAWRENISVAPLRIGNIKEVLVVQGQKVRKGDLLYTLDTTELDSARETLSANINAQKANLDRLRHLPRPETLKPLEAAVKEARLTYENAQTQLERYERLSDKRSVSQDEYTQKKYAAALAKASLEKAEAQLKEVRVGSWIYELQQAEAQHRSTQAALREIDTKILLSQVKAPRDGEVLQINVRPGEGVMQTPTTPPILLGDTQWLQVRVDIDEVNASLVRPKLSGVAYLKGDAKRFFPIEFVRIEPYMLPKKNLTGLSTERVDVRVLQMIYRFTKPQFPVYVGQQVDVYLKK